MYKDLCINAVSSYNISINNTDEGATFECFSSPYLPSSKVGNAEGSIFMTIHTLSKVELMLSCTFPFATKAQNLCWSLISRCMEVFTSWRSQSNMPSSQLLRMRLFGSSFLLTFPVYHLKMHVYWWIQKYRSKYYWQSLSL